jgi:hypothetical protein
MASSNRRLMVAALVMPLFLLVISGRARANNIFVNTTSGMSENAPLCSLPDAIVAHNMQAIVNGCGAGNGLDTIFIEVTGQISINETLEITNSILTIQGPPLGCTGPGPCGITIDGGGSVQILKADAGTDVTLNDLTLADGFATAASLGTADGTGTGGAIFADGAFLEVDDCLLRNNQVEGPLVIPVGTLGGQGGAIFGNAGAIVIVNSTFANNTAVTGSFTQSFGGAIFLGNPTTQITNCTFSGNMADVGGGYGTLNSGTIPHVKGTLFASNPGGNCDGDPFDLNFNISDDASCAFSMPESLNMTNPLLETLANNGGPTDTFALETFPMTSPAIGRIPVANCTDQQAVPQPLGTDQRLFTRPDPGDPTTCDSGAYEVGAVPPIVIVPKSERLQVARSTTAGKDQVNSAFTFIYNGDPDCELGIGADEDALNFGFSLSIYEGTCAALPANGLMLSLAPFVVHKVNKEQYGTLFQSSGLQQTGETVSARMVALPPPSGACSAYALNLEVAGLNTSTLGLSGGNPFAIVLTDSPGGQAFADASVCFDVTNAVVGNQIPTPGHGVRRVRRR